jgi:hypothetical protein
MVISYGQQNHCFLEKKLSRLWLPPAFFFGPPASDLPLEAVSATGFSTRAGAGAGDWIISSSENGSITTISSVTRAFDKKKKKSQLDDTQLTSNYGQIISERIRL